MSYLVLARKYRPQIFDEVLGQDHIVEILKKAISSQRIAHSYLFCGPRGIGKTSCARILAKSLNCEKGLSVKPCGECSTCMSVAKGNSLDVLEIDGASNRGIDEIRTLRENVKFAPSYGRFKIYIVDEVHMLTTEAFNALLKTLEEPPEHVKFIFATTAANKVPATILSRCQRFDFKRIKAATISEAMLAIAKKEKLKIDKEAMFAIAKAAQGSLRDALSIFDQLSALSDRGIKAEDVYGMLGLVEHELLFELAEAIAQKNCARSLEVLDGITEKGKDIKQLIKDLIEHFRNLMIIKVGGKSLGRMVPYPVEVKEMYLKQCEEFSLKDILSAIEVFMNTNEVSRLTELERIPLEIALAQLTYVDGPSQSKDALGIQPKKEKVIMASGNRLNNEKGEVVITRGDEPQEKEPIRELLEDETEEAVEESDIIDRDGLELIDLDKIKESWSALTFAVSKEKISLATYLQEGAPISYNKNKLIIGFPSSSMFQKESLEETGNLHLVENIFSRKLGTDIHIAYQITQDHIPQEDEPHVKSVLSKFKGKVVNQWHNE